MTDCVRRELRWVGWIAGGVIAAVVALGGIILRYSDNHNQTPRERGAQSRVAPTPPTSEFAPLKYFPKSGAGQ